MDTPNEVAQISDVDLRKVAHLMVDEINEQKVDLLTYIELGLLILAVLLMSVVPGLAGPATLLPNLGIRSVQCLRHKR